MEDLKKVQEFFSKPMSEELDLSNPEFTDSGLQMYLINLNKELSYYLKKGEAADLRYAEMLKKDIADARAELDRRIKSKKGTNEAKQETGVGMVKKQLDALGVKYEMSKTDKVRPFKVIYQPINKSDEFYDKFENIVDLFNLKGIVKSSMNEAKQEDPTDIIAMDVPLFLRMLEYAREDAEQDVDLHKVTERAIEAVKLRGLLSMEDYQDIVGEPQKIEEDAFEDTWVGNRKTAQSFVDQYKDNPFKETDIKYAQAYLNIDDLVDANKYWNNFNLAGKTSGVSSMKSLKELVKGTLTEKKKKRDRCLRIADRKFKKPSAYKSAAATRCRQGEIWQDLK